jgi:hypothetical protein
MWIEPGRAPAARPRTPLASTDPDATSGTLIDKFYGSSLRRDQHRPELIHRHTGQFCHPDRDPIMTMTGMPTRIAIQMIPHVNEFLSHDNLDRKMLLLIDPREIDEHGMNLGCVDKAVRSSIRRGYPAADPSGVGLPARREPKVLSR